MKWLRKHKTEIIGGVQYFIMMYTMLIGFWYSYLWIWFKLGLPIKWLSIVIAMGLAMLSLFGLCQWITKGE